jgi:hypothetical protein
MRIHNLYEDTNGESHFRDIEVDWVEETWRALRACRQGGEQGRRVRLNAGSGASLAFSSEPRG